MICEDCGHAPCECDEYMEIELLRTNKTVQPVVQPIVQPVFIGFSSGSVTVKPPRNRVTILSWNLQNYTHDMRQTFQRSMQNPRAHYTAAFVGAVLRAFKVQTLLVMETGSDVSLALQNIGSYLKHVGCSTYDPFVTDLTHATPELRKTLVIDISSPKASDVHALKNLLGPYELEEPSLEFKNGGAATAWQLYQECRLLEGGPPMTGDNATDAGALLKHANSVFAEGLQIYGDQPPEQVRELLKAAQRLWSAKEVGPQLQYAASVAKARRGAFALVPSKARTLVVSGAELLVFAKLVESIVQKKLQGKALVAYMLAQEFLDDRIPALVCLLCIRYVLRISIDDPEKISKLKDPTFVYRALEQLGLIKVGAEAYGICLLDMNPYQRLLLSKPDNAQVIVRLDEDGELIDTQKPGEVTNHRSAMRMVYPMPGPKLIETFLFHTRFTPPKDPRTKKALSKAKTLEMRADSILSLAKWAQPQSCLGIPRLLFGDFNLPGKDSKRVLESFVKDMGTLGYTRLPEDGPKTTLKALSTILSGGEGIYNEPYDAVFVKNLDKKHIESCRQLKVLEMLDHVDFDPLVREAAKGYADIVYERQITKLDSKLQDLAKKILEAQNLSLRPTTAFLPAFDQARAELDLCCVNFRKRKLDENGNQDRLECDTFLEELQEQLDQARKDRSGQAIKALEEAIELTDYTLVSLKQLETSRSVRVHAAYRYAVSDHIPILITLDLDV